jgi:hypothetical protein
MRYRTGSVVVIAAILMFGGLQLLPIARRTNPPVHPERSFVRHLNVPPDIRALMRRACMDCHSNETEWPWYSRIAPLSWAIANDVNRGRRAMNLSEWSTGPGRRPEIAASMLAAACEDARSRRMPRFPYSTLHHSARLQPAEIERFCAWTQTEFDRLIRLKRAVPKTATASLPLSR